MAQGNPGKIEFGTPGAWKRACPVWGGLGGNVRQQCRDAPPFHSIIAFVRSVGVIFNRVVLIRIMMFRRRNGFRSQSRRLSSRKSLMQYKSN
jgi:hypothetical protein